MGPIPNTKNSRPQHFLDIENEERLKQKVKNTGTKLLKQRLGEDNEGIGIPSEKSKDKAWGKSKGTQKVLSLSDIEKEEMIKSAKMAANEKRITAARLHETSRGKAMFDKNAWGGSVVDPGSYARPNSIPVIQHNIEKNSSNMSMPSAHGASSSKNQSSSEISFWYSNEVEPKDINAPSEWEPVKNSFSKQLSKGNSKGEIPIQKPKVNIQEHKSNTPNTHDNAKDQSKVSELGQKKQQVKQVGLLPAQKKKPGKKSRMQKLAPAELGFFVEHDDNALSDN